MLVWLLTILFINVSKCQRRHTSEELVHIKEMDNLGQFDDAQHRGPNWYDFSSRSGESTSSLNSWASSSLEFSSYSAGSDTHSGSSIETAERKMATRMYRACTPCVHDMLKKYSNIGIKWICAGYQRARRTFKSECSMRYRNCQDGTMFAKLYDHKCRNDSYHGRHWFYDYKI